MEEEKTTLCYSLGEGSFRDADLWEAVDPIVISAAQFCDIIGA